MKDNQLVIRSAIAGILALGGVAAVGQGVAAEMGKGPQMMPKGWEACGGVAKAGLNDCGVKTSAHSCAGLAKADSEPDSYVYLPKGLCERIVGGHVLAVSNKDVESLKERMMKMMNP
jgi:uncharacterized membrane protein